MVPRSMRKSRGSRAYPRQRNVGGCRHRWRQCQLRPGVRHPQRQTRSADDRHCDCTAATLTKTVFAYTVMQLVDQGKLKLDTPIKADLRHAAAELRPRYRIPGTSTGRLRTWRTTRAGRSLHPHELDPFDRLQQLLVHRTRQEVRIHFEPGTRYSYSGEGFILLQFVVERGRKEQGLGLDVGGVMNGIFDRLA